MRAIWSGENRVDLTDAISSKTRCTSVAVRAGSHVQSIRTRYSRPGDLLRGRRGGDAVGAAELLPDRVEQPRLQHERHRPERQPVRIVVLERPGEDDRHLALRRDALLHRPFDDPGRRRDAEVPPGLVRVGRRQAREVGLDERLDGLRREAADEDEREVARVGEARLVERQRLREIPLVHGCRRLRLPPRAVLAEDGVDGLVEHDVRARHLVREQPLGLRRHRGERGRVGARLREPQVQELEHRLEILRRAAALHALVELVDERPDRDGLAGQDLVEHHGVEPPDASRGRRRCPRRGPE